MYVIAIGLGLIVATVSIGLLAYARHNDLPKRFRFSAIGLATAGMLLVLFSVCGGVCHMIYGRCSQHSCTSSYSHCQSMPSCHHGTVGDMDCSHNMCSGSKCAAMGHECGKKGKCSAMGKCGDMDNGKCSGHKKMMCKKMMNGGEGEDIDVNVEINDEDTVVTVNH